MLIYTIKQFIRNGVHLGHYKWECDYRLSYFLLGIRNSIHIINLYYSLYILKQVLYITYNMGLVNQKIFIVNNAGFKVDQNFSNINNLCLSYINNKWTGGLLTNQKMLYTNNEGLFLKFYGLGYASILPSYVFVSNIESTGSSIFEAIILDIPNSSLLDSNQGFYGIFYGLHSNDDSFVSINMFTKLFIKIFLKSEYDSKKIFNEQKKKKIIQKYKILWINFYKNTPYSIKFKKKRRFLSYIPKDIWYRDLKNKGSLWKRLKKLKTIVFIWKKKNKSKKKYSK